MKCYLTAFLLVLFTSFNLVSQTMFQDYHIESNIIHTMKHRNFMGGGVAIFDFDNDGDEDVYLCGGLDQDHFYENKGDMNFINISQQAGFSGTDDYYTAGVTIGDIDNDGYKDIFLMTHTLIESNLWTKNLLYKNNGNGTFTQIWTEDDKDNAMTMGASFIDYNQDGLLDIYVVNYVDQIKFTSDEDGIIDGFDHTCFSNFLYRNNGDNSFTNLTEEVKLGDTGCALAVIASDYDQDADTDILIANDFGAFIQPNSTYQNIDGQFEEVSQSTQTDIPMFGMGLSAGDIDLDGDMDYYITNLGSNKMLVNDNGIFQEKAIELGVDDKWNNIQDSILTVGWGTQFIDVDLDQDLDLYVANGYVPSPGFINTGFNDSDALFINEGNSFISKPELTGILNPQVTRGMASGDLDNDGDIDIISLVLQAPINESGLFTKVYLNNNQDGNYLKIKLIGTQANRDAVGSQVIAYIDGTPLLREVNGGSSHCSYSSNILHFGLGNATLIDSILIRWTGSNNLQKLYNVDANQNLEIEQDIPSQTLENVLVKKGYNLYPNPFYDEFVVNKFVNKEDLKIYNSLGQLVQFDLISGYTSRIKINPISKPGIYFIEFLNDDLSFKILKQN